MNSVVCTLYEGSYHLGVAALINSLYKNGFKGNIVIGYKDNLPQSLKDIYASNNTNTEINKFRTATKLHFIHVNTSWHLANYKPDFLLYILKDFLPDAEAICYFDPDIVINAEWVFYNNWIKKGVAVVQELGAIYMPSSHPMRKEWENLIEQENEQTRNKLNAGINSGFCGVKKADIQFLNLWSKFIHSLVDKYGVNAELFAQKNAGYAFHLADQDTFNIAAMACNCTISEMGPDAMGFISGGWPVMYHAAGAPKPWEKKYLLNALKGVQPSLADKFFWNNCYGPIKVFSSLHLKLKQLGIKAASFIGRFYRKQ